MSSLYFEDLSPGQSFTSNSRTVTEADVVGFAGLSGDFNPIHMDTESTKDGMYGQRVAHGILGISIATGLLDRMGLFKESMAAMLSIDEWRFVKPIFIGDTIRLQVDIESTRLTSSGRTGVVRRRMQLSKQDGSLVQEGIITVLVKCRSTQTAPSDSREGSLT